MGTRPPSLDRVGELFIGEWTVAVEHVTLDRSGPPSVRTGTATGAWRARGMTFQIRLDSGERWDWLLLCARTGDGRLVVVYYDAIGSQHVLDVLLHDASRSLVVQRRYSRERLRLGGSIDRDHVVGNLEQPGNGSGPCSRLTVTLDRAI